MDKANSQVMNEENQTPTHIECSKWTKDLKFLPKFTQQLLEKCIHWIFQGLVGLSRSLQ